MSCWDILGIEQTSDRAAIDAAFRQQQKFATNEDQVRLNDAYRSALEEAGFEPESTQGRSAAAPEADVSQVESTELSARDQQIVRETVIQIQALLNDSSRRDDPQAWKAILSEPPSDQPGIRAAVAERLTSQVRPMAENGALPVGVCRFLDDWFGWQTLTQVDPHLDLGGQSRPGDGSAMQSGQSGDGSAPPPMTNFWPAVIGWIVGLAVLAAIFSNLVGNQ